MKKVCLLLSVVLTLALGGCGQSQSDDSGLEEFTLVLDWYPNAIHSFLYTAQEKGYFAEEGLELVIQFPANPNDGISLPAVGKADAGLYYLQDAIITASEESVPIVSIGAITQSSLNVVIALEESGIAGAADLAGKRIGYAGTSLSEEQIKAMLESVGLSDEDCEFVDVGFDLLTALTTQKVDATIGNMVNHEVPQLEEQGFAVNYFYPTDFGNPEVYELVILAGTRGVQDNPEKLAGFLRACQKGFADMKADPEASLKILLENQNMEHFPLIEAVERESLGIVLPTMETETGAFLAQDGKVWQENADWLFERGILSEPVDATQYMVNLLAE